MNNDPKLLTRRRSTRHETVHASPVDTSTVYAEILALLDQRGWARGVRSRGRALDLRTAIDRVVGVNDPTKPGSPGSKLARSARIGAHLRDLLAVRSLDAWQDAPQRSYGEVRQVLSHASIAWGDD